MKKRIISMLLVVMLIVSMLPGTIVLATTAESTAVLTVEDPWANPGGTVDVNLVIAQNPGILGATFVVSWDESLTLVADASGAAFGHMTYTAPSRYTASGTNFVWFGNEVGDAVDGVALTLTFQVPETAENNDILPVWVTYTEGDVIDGNDNDVTLSITDGHVRVITYKPGDVTGDGRVNARDLVRLSQYISDGCKTDPEGYNAEVVVDACDVTEDGRVNARDLIRLSQYISDGSQTNPEGYNAVLHPAKLPECGHTDMLATDAKAAECTVDGNIAYWYCADCAKYFSDADATMEIAYTDTIIAASGHTEVVDPAKAPGPGETGLTEGSHCSVCGKVIVAQQIVDALSVNYHAITYRNLQGAESPTITQYAEHEGLATLPEVSVDGYLFMGWYTEQNGGVRVTEIPKDSTQDFELYARWEIINYTITYDCGAGTNAASNVSSYTVNDTVILSDAKLAGYLFNGWRDEDGNIVSRLSKGTIGDILLTASWKTNRCLAHPIETITNPLYDPIMTVQEGDEYSFIYYLGYIESIPFGYVGTPYYHNGTTSYSQEHSTSEATAESITKTVNKVTEDTHSWQSEVSVSNEAEFDCKFGVKDTLTVAISHNQSGSYTTTEENGKSTTVSQEYVSASTETANITPESSPVGWYRYVNYATVDVFATVTYNAIENKYYISNFNAVRDITTAWDYSAKSASFDDETDSDLPFEIPEDFYDFIASLTEATDGLIIKENGDTCTVERYLGEETVVNIPSYYKNSNGDILKVAGFSADAFAGNTTVTSVTLGQYITEIPTEAFYGCSALETVAFEGEVTAIGEKTFAGCENLNIALPASLLTLGANAFDGCEKIDSVVIPASLALGDQAFANCGELYVSATPEKTEQLAAIINSGATTLNLSLISFGTSEEAIEVGALELPDSIKTFTLTGAYAQQYNLSVSANTDQTVIKNVAIDGGCSIGSGELTLIETSIDGVLQFNGSQLQLQGTVEMTTIDSTSATLTISSTTGNMAELISDGGIQASGDLTLSGVMDANIQGAYGKNGIKAANLTIEIIGDLNVCGGHGTNATTAGATGSEGAAAICTDNLVADIIGSLVAVGGNGGNGATGYTYEGADWVSRSGNDGGIGGNGGIGGSAVQCTNLYIRNASKLDLKLASGDGGNGGKGGKGEPSAAANGNPYYSGDGGTGGQGGNGGTILDIQSIDIEDSLQSLTVMLGSGGDGGNGGDGGDADKWWAQYSHPGSGGIGGNGGTAGVVGFSVESLSVEYAIEDGAAGTSGSSGATGASDAR